MSILTFKITHEEWLDSTYRKSKLISSRSCYKTGIKKWDNYLLPIKKNDLEVLSELKAKNNDSLRIVVSPRSYVQHLHCFQYYL